MPVIVNELEVVVAPPEPAVPSEPTPRSAPPAASALGPRELAAVLERQARQASRVFAH